MNPQIITNGGAPLDDCPASFEQADQWASQANLEASKYSEPQWRFDCGFKLDYDGPILSFSSRFYPPKEIYGPNWDGFVNVEVLGQVIERREFVCTTLTELRSQVEAYKREWHDRLIEQFGAQSRNGASPGGKDYDHD